MFARLSFQLRCEYWIFECHASFTLHIERLCCDFDRVSVDFKERITTQISDTEHSRANVESVVAKEQLIFDVSICITSIECDVFWWFCADRREKVFFIRFQLLFEFKVPSCEGKRVQVWCLFFYWCSKTKEMLLCLSYRMLLDGRVSIENAMFAARLEILLGLPAECHLQQL